MAKQNKYERNINPSRADEREARTGMRQSRGAMIAKIVFGALFIWAGFDPSDGGWTFSYFVFCLILGCGMIAWGLLPYLEARKKRQQEEEAKREERAAKILSVPLEKFGDGDAKKAERLAEKYGEEPILGVDWNKDGKLDWKDAAVDEAVIREGKAKLFGEDGGPKDA